MKTSKRSVSPFGLLEPEAGPFDELRQAFSSAFQNTLSDQSSHLKSFDDASGLPFAFEEVWDAPSNDCPRLLPLCQYLVEFRTDFEDKGLQTVLYNAMLTVFDQKTELFLIDHHNEEHCKKMGWAEPYRDAVLFSKERDLMVGHYFAPMADKNPGLFSEFVTRWVQTLSRDRLLHFFDFCLGSRNPTFEHYLLFTHPALARLLRGKDQMRVLFERTAPLLKKVSSPTWETDVRKTLDI